MNKREKIFSTALNLFVEHGFHGTPTSKIAKEAGVANGTLFHHFNTKEDLIIEFQQSDKDGGLFSLLSLPLPEYCLD